METSNNLVTTGYGKENADKIGYAVQSISEADIPDAATSANNAIQGKFSGTSLGQNDDLSQIRMRPSNSILGNNYGLIVIDGVPMERSSSAGNRVDGSGIPGLPIQAISTLGISQKLLF